MQKFLQIALVFVLCHDLYARAGGGGSYRSSSSSSSSRSSGSSSSRSSSSSSYRPLSSSPSYSSSSSSYSSSSRTSYRAPDYRELPIKEVETYSAEITLQANGRLVVAEQGTVKIRTLPVGATAWLFDQNIGKPVGKVSGTGGSALLAYSTKLYNPRLVIVGAKAPEANSIVVRFAEAKVTATLSADSTIEAQWQALSPKGQWVMPVYNVRESYIGHTQNVASGKIERHSLDAYLAPKDANAPAHYRVLHFDEGRKAEYLELTLGHTSASERAAAKGPLITANPTHTAFAPVVIQLPSDKTALAKVIVCKDNWSYSSNCETVRTLLAESSQQGNRLTVKILEPVVNAEVLLRVYLHGGTLYEPALSKKFAHQIYHFWKFGGKPTWAYWSSTLFFLIAAIVAVIVFVRFTRRQKERRLAQERAAEQQKRENRILLFLRQHDPNFSLEAFYRRGREIATRIQHSWSAGDMRDCRRFLSQGVYNRFRLQLKIMREFEHRRNVMADFQIRSFAAISYARSGEFDCLTVRLEAEARDTWVSADAPPIASQKAVAKSGFADPGCPTCGAPLPETDSIECSYCHSPIQRKNADWLLSRVKTTVE